MIHLPFARSAVVLTKARKEDVNSRKNVAACEQEAFATSFYR